MNKIVVILTACSLIAFAAQAAEKAEEAAKAEVFYVVKHTDYAKAVSYKMLSQDEYKSLQSEISNESKFWDKALSATEKAWKEDPSTAKKMLPRTAITQRKITVEAKFPDQEKATARINNLEKAMKSEGDQKARRATTSTRKPKENKGGSDREALHESARSLFSTKLAEVIAKAAEKAAAAEEAAEKKKGSK